MEDIAGRGDSGLVERNGNDSVPAKVADITDLDGQIVSRLPLKIERVIDGIGQLVGAVISGEGKELLPVQDSCLYSDSGRSRVWQVIVDVHRIACRSGTQSRAPRAGEIVVGNTSNP